MIFPNAQSIIEALGGFAVFGVALIIFFETATILGSFLPGDSLLFLLGLSLASYLTTFPVWLALLLVFVAAVLGSQVGFWLGGKVGSGLFQRKQTWFFNEKVLKRTEAFFERYGARSIILARFVPILRALIPMLSGIVGLNRGSFFRFNLIGGFAWVVGIMTLGYLLGTNDFVHQHIEGVILSFVILSSLPLPIELLRDFFMRRSTVARK